WELHPAIRFNLLWPNPGPKRISAPIGAMGSVFQRELSADGPLKKNGKSAERRGKGWKFPKKRKPDPLKNAEKAC
ncbi:hypothetical protein, partial [Flavobacterium sharifuzzamanii]|uniref:hypothetical protein n=1 Tax=Flavobacterium sharifuzzamanii TaxID=2211133 RepID=UPI00193E042A